MTCKKIKYEDCTIDLVKVKEEMEKRKFKYDEENLEGWTNTLVDSLEELYGIETKLAKVFKNSQCGSLEDSLEKEAEENATQARYEKGFGGE